MKNLFKTGTFLIFSFLSFQSLAAHVECVISGTPTQQTYTADFCSSNLTTSNGGVHFRLVADKEVDRVEWTKSIDDTAVSRPRWSSCTGTSCYVSFSTQGTMFATADACATKVYYKDFTWENVDSCATGIFSYGGGF